MSKKHNGVKYSKKVLVQSRRSRTLEILNLQLKFGTKNTIEGPVPLSEKDIERIKKDIHNLKQKL